MLELKGVSKQYGDFTALHPTDLHVPEGQTTVLIGPSGCGKSTLLRLVIGLIQPDSGRIIFEGNALSTENLIQIRRKMGYVIQDGGLFPHLTARGNATLMARYLDWERDRIEHRLHELSELTQFPESGLDRFPVELSGGQRQRVSLMRALMLDPDILLLDEPLGALDPMIRADLQRDLRQIYQQLGKTVLMVTHDMGEAGFFADRIVLMRRGKIVQIGSLDDLLENPQDEFVTRFINAQRSPLEKSAG